MHPRRLLDAVKIVAAHVVRVDGYVWLATQPHTAFRLHVSAGLASLDPHVKWTREAQDEGNAPSTRLTLTTTETATGHDSHAAVLDMLRAALLTPAGLAIGPTGWADLDDPFSAAV